MSATGGGVVDGERQKSCLSCAIIGGGGMIAAGGYVYFQVRKFIRPGHAMALPTVFALGLTSYGLIIIAKTADEYYSNR